MDEGLLAEQVFGIQLVMEMILNHAIRKDTGQVCGSNISSLRLVQKSWLETITKLLQKSKEPLFQLLLTKDNSLIDNVGEEGKLLDRFLNALATKPSIPTFSVRILQSFFVHENHASLSKMLVRFGAVLVKLKLYVPVDVDRLSLEFIFPRFTLPSLRKLSVHLSEFGLPGRESWVNSNASHFINFLLNEAPALTHFEIRTGNRHDGDDFPLAFQLFTLPPSVTTLELYCELHRVHLELLVESDLPNLTSLTLLIPGKEIYPDDLLFGILDNCRKTLRQLTLRLRGKPNFNDPWYVTTLRFPVMEKLEEVTNFSPYCELEAGGTTLLPKLSRLSLVNQTPSNVRKWTENSCFMSGVETLKCFPVEEYGRVRRPDSVNLEMMQSLHLGFPNVRDLEVTVCGMQVCGLKYLFKEMKTLSRLGIVVTAVGWTVDVDPNLWDALLIGVPIEFAKAFRSSIKFLEDVQLRNGSIKNLQELTHLHLETRRSSAHEPSVTEPIISDLTFLLALLKMPKLKELTFKGYFQASDEMAERWRSEGRKLTYSAAVQ